MDLTQLSDADFVNLLARHNIAPPGEADLSQLPTEQLQGLLGPQPAGLPLPPPATLAATASRESLETLAGPQAPQAMVNSPRTMGARVYDMITDPRGLGATAGGALGTALSGGMALPLVLAGLGGFGGQGALETQARGGQPAGRTGLDLGALTQGATTLPPPLQMLREGATDLGYASLGRPMRHREMERMVMAGTLGALTEAGAQTVSRYVNGRLSPRAEKVQQVLGADTPLTLEQAFPAKVSEHERRVADVAQQLSVIPPAGTDQWQAVMAQAEGVPVDMAPVNAIGKVLTAREAPIKGDLRLATRLEGVDPAVPFASAQALANDLGTEAVKVGKEGLPGATAHDFGAAKDAVLDAMETSLAGNPPLLAEFQAAREATRQFHEQVLVSKIISRATDPKKVLRGADGAEIPVPSGIRLLNLVHKGERLGRFDGRVIQPATLQHLRDLAEASAASDVGTPMADPIVKTSRIIQGTLMTRTIFRALEGSMPTATEAGALVGTMVIPKVWTTLIARPEFVRAAMVYAKNPGTAAMATAAMERLTLQAVDQVLQGIHPEDGVLPYIPPAPHPSPLPLGRLPARHAPVE